MAASAGEYYSIDGGPLGIGGLVVAEVQVSQRMAPAVSEGIDQLNPHRRRFELGGAGLRDPSRGW